MNRYRLLTVCLGLIFAALACGPQVSSPTIDPGQVGTIVAATLQAAAPTSAPPTSTATATPPPQLTHLWTCFGCGGSQVWVLGAGAPYQTQLPVEMGEFYDYSPSSGKILFAQAWGDHGAGPGNIAVSDLAILDPSSGLVEVVHPDNVVEAYWAPNGIDFAYIYVTPTQYELRWRTGAGADILLAINATFTFSVAPSGDRVAFARDSGYDVQLVPGLYAVGVGAPLAEWMLAPVDKEGTGSIEDQPYWSWDGSEVLFSDWGSGGAEDLVLANADGSSWINLVPSPGLPSWASNIVDDLLWHPDGQHLLINPTTSLVSMGGPPPLVMVRLDRASGWLVDPLLLAEAGDLIAWDVPGVSLWVSDEAGIPQRVMLP